jgi:hypothetical protein
VDIWKQEAFQISNRKEKQSTYPCHNMLKYINADKKLLKTAKEKQVIYT